MIELTITSTALIIVVLSLRHFLKGRISLRLQYALWALVLVRLLAPVNLPQSPISVLNAMRTYETAVASSEFGAQVSAYEEPMNTAPARDAALLDLSAAPTPQKAAADWDKLLNLVWHAGIAVVSLCLLLSNLSFAIKLRKVRNKFPADDYRLKVYVVENLPTPCLYGLFSPAVYITTEVAGDKTRLSHVLAHELCHYRHGDHIWSALRSLCLAVYWFNPFVWLAAGFSRRDAELSCDESTIKRLGEGNRIEYGRTLIGLTCQKRGAMDLFCCATTMLDSKKGIQERIALIAKKPKTAVCTLAAVLLILALATGCTFTDAKPGEETSSAGTPLTETADSTQDPDVADDTFSNGYKIYDGNNPLSKEILQKATELTIINVDSLDFLRDAPNLTHIKAGNDAYEDTSVSGDIGALSGLTKLQSIILTCSNVTGDIGSLSGLGKLQELNLSRTNVSGDISTLNGLEKLKTMSLASDGVTGDLSALDGMSALESFDLSGNGITGDLSDLRGLSYLLHIQLSSTPNVTGDINMLKGMHLSSIHFIETNIAIDLSALSGISGLTYIDLASDNISGNLSDLSGMTDLENIFLEGKGITGDISALSGLSDLHYLALCSTPNVTGDISMLKGCANLKDIMLIETDITVDLGALSEYSSLISITLHSPNVSGDLGDLSGFSVLSRIHLASPNVTGNLSALGRLNNLALLSLACPNVKGDISALSGHTQLAYINLATTTVSGDIGALSGLINLHHLNLSSTGVSGDIGALDGLAKLSDIEFTNTNIVGHT